MLFYKDAVILVSITVTLMSIFLHTSTITYNNRLHLEDYKLV